MFGGTAKTYVTWKLIGEPFEEAKKLYINVEHPLNHSIKKVRWYADKAHNDLMPHADRPFPGKMFGFEDKDDYILGIREIDLTEEETAEQMDSNWTRGGNWRFGMFLGGIWYAPKDAEIPSIANTDKIFRITWNKFVLSARAISKKEHDGSKSGFWFDEVSL